MFYKLLLPIFVVFFTLQLAAQNNKYQTNNAKIAMEMLLELKKGAAGNGNKMDKLVLKAHNDQGISTLDEKTGQIQFSVPMKAFKFEKPTFQRSFQSSTILKVKEYPYVKFEGRILNYKKSILRKRKGASVTIEGGLTIRDVTKPIKATGTFTKLEKGTVSGKIQFAIPDANVFSSNAEENKGLTENVKISVKATIEVILTKEK